MVDAHTSFANRHLRLLMVLLIVGIIATGLSNALTAYNNERILNEQKRFVSTQAEATRQDVEEHSNATRETLSLIKNALVNQTVVAEQFQRHINQTATAAPIVQKLEPIINRNNELLNQLVRELNQTGR